MNDSRPSAANLRPVVRLIASYRMLCGCFIYLSAQTGLIDGASLFDSTAYQRCALVYTVGAMVCLIMVLVWPRHLQKQYTAHLSFDLIVLGLVFYYSGGSVNGHAILPILASAFSIAVLPALQAFGVVATGIVILLGVESLLTLTTTWPTSLFSIGVNGLAAMGLMGLLFWLKARLQLAQQTEQTARLDYQQLAEVNWDIINCMNTGCIIVDDRELIVHINPSACVLFATEVDRCIGQNLGSFNEQLYRIHQQESREGYHEARPIRLIGLNSYVLPHFFHLDRGQRTVILLDNLHEEIANVQQSRLATFGKMIHALMHEITNPLATIEQALQVYRQPGEQNNSSADNGGGGKTDELMALLNRQIVRMARIVKSTRNLLPNRQIEQEIIDLHKHINSVITDFNQEYQGTPNSAAIQFDIDAASLAGLMVRFDPTHLSQIIGNLVRNSIDHAHVDPEELRITMTGRRAEQSIELEYWDNGIGIDREQTEHIYKAFYSSDQEHAGLGLHISNELCQLNGAHFEYISLAVPARFRLSLPLEY